jgi:SAM-dependent methyltransferase
LRQGTQKACFAAPHYYKGGTKFMGITKSSLLGMCYAAANGVEFKNTLMVARHAMLMTKGEVKKILRTEDCGLNELYSATNKFPYAEWLFGYFGAETVDSIDYSNYEGANIIHDLNIPVPDALKNKYDCVWDGGTLEHVFNYPAALKNCMDMVKPGGHLILETPGNNCFGHGFYQFSPELFFSLLDKHNGFSETKIFIQGKFNRWYEVISPKIIKIRTSICCTKGPAMLFVISRKISYVPDAVSALQSDYVDMWGGAKDKAKPNKFTWKYFEELYFKLVPKKLQSAGLALFGMTVLSKFLNTKKKMYRYAPEFVKIPVRHKQD